VSKKILEEVRARLDAAGFDHLPSQQIVLERVGVVKFRALMGWPARSWANRSVLGRPLRCFTGPATAATDPVLPLPLGLALFAAAPADEWWDFDILPTYRPDR